jgi:hypothetical protein
MIKVFLCLPFDQAVRTEDIALAVSLSISITLKTFMLYCDLKCDNIDLSFWEIQHNRVIVV